MHHRTLDAVIAEIEADPYGCFFFGGGGDVRARSKMSDLISLLSTLKRANVSGWPVASCATCWHANL